MTEDEAKASPMIYKSSSEEVIENALDMLSVIDPHDAEAIHEALTAFLHGMLEIERERTRIFAGLAGRP